jgi:hypothetical protein
MQAVLKNSNFRSKSLEFISFSLLLYCDCEACIQIDRHSIDSLRTLMGHLRDRVDEYKDVLKIVLTPKNQVGETPCMVVVTNEVTMYCMIVAVLSCLVYDKKDNHLFPIIFESLKEPELLTGLFGDLFHALNTYDDAITVFFSYWDYQHLDDVVLDFVQQHFEAKIFNDLQDLLLEKWRQIYVKMPLGDEKQAPFSALLTLMSLVPSSTHLDLIRCSGVDEVSLVKKLAHQIAL